DPSPEVVRIERRVATGWDGIESAPTASATRDPDDADSPFDVPLPSSLAHPMAFVGRAKELDALASELGRVQTSGLRGVFLDGESGIGKTSLTSPFDPGLVSSASATVVYGRCDQGGVSLQPFRSVLAACVAP